MHVCVNQPTRDCAARKLAVPQNETETMNKLILMLTGGALLGTAAWSFAADPMPTKNTNTAMDPKMMDVNKDGMISKTEFTKHHEAVYDRMPKNASGQVMMKGMEMAQSEMHDGKMNDHTMSKDGSMNKHGSMDKDSSMKNDAQ